MKRIGIVGSRRFTNKKLIEIVIERCKDEFGDLTVVSGGQPKGADGFAKDIALADDVVDYIEFPPKHYKYNEHCYFSKENYDQPYKVSNYFERNQEIVDHSDLIIAFIPEDIKIEDSSGTNDTVTKAKNSGVDYKIIKG